MALEQNADENDNSSDYLPHPCPFPSEDIEAAKAWLIDPENRDLSAWDHEKNYASGKWHILEALMAEVVGITTRLLRKGIYAVCKEEWGDDPTTKRMSHDMRNNIIRNYTRILQSQCKKAWNPEIKPWIAAALGTWVKRAICLWKAEVQHSKLPEDKIRESTETCYTATQARPVCKEYDELVNFVVRNAEVNEKHNLALKPTWLGYNKDPFDPTAKRFRRLVKDRMIEDGILKLRTRAGASVELQLDHSVSFQDYPKPDMCRWIQDYFSEGYGVTVKTAVGKIMDYCQLKLHGPYVPPTYRPEIPSTQSTPGTFRNTSRLDLVILAPLDCGEYLDFINKVVRKALRFTYPQTIYEIDFQLGCHAFSHERSEQLVGRVFRRMVKDNILIHTGTSLFGRYDLCPSFEAKRFYLRRKLPSSDAYLRLDTSNKLSLLRLEEFLDANVDSICQEDFIRLYGADAGSRYDELQSEFMPKIKHEVIDDDLPTTVAKVGSNSAAIVPSIEVKQQPCSGREAVAEKTTAPWLVSCCESRLASSSFGASSSLTLPSSEGPLYPSHEDMPSPPSDLDFSDDETSDLKSEGEDKYDITTPQPFDVKAIFQSKMRELERKRKLEREASQGETSAPKRQHC